MTKAGTMKSAGQAARREAFYARTRDVVFDYVNADGTGKVKQFTPPYREVLWILPALYTGSQEYIDLANRMVAGFNTELKPGHVHNGPGEVQGKMFGIFQSNTLAHTLHHFGRLMTPAARAVAVWHTEQVFKTYRGAAQPDFKFHGANDNYPMMASAGLILGGEALGNQQAVTHGVWNLNQFRRLLSRAAWASEFNSSTYSALTLTSVARIASYAHDPTIRELALEIEKRLWAEVLLHYHPGTMRQSGPQSRAYCIDYAGHTHSLQLVLWCAFGSELTGRDPIKSYFEPDGIEVMHFSGFPFQSVAEFCDFLDTDLHVPEDLARLITERQYPALLRGRSECMGHFDGQSGQYRTCTWMEKDYSLGTSSIPLCGGEQSATLYATYALKPEVKSFRDSASVFFKYFTAAQEMGAMESDTDGRFVGEKFSSNQGWCYAMQHENTAVLLATPNLKNTPLETDTLKLSVIFPAHYGAITRSIIGDGTVQNGATGASAELAPVSVEAGEVYIHIQPLIPTDLPRRAALRFIKQNHYEMLELVNYEGESRRFEREELSHVQNGFVLTIDSKDNHASLEAFHRRHSDVLITDYLLSNHRFFLYQRESLQMELVLTSFPVFGVQTEAINGRHVPTPVFESNQIDVNRLPFMTGDVKRNIPFFPWKTLDMPPFYGLYWAIGSRGLAAADNYHNTCSSRAKQEGEPI
jgi:hypothetical protein